MNTEEQQLVQDCLRANRRAQRKLYEQYKLPLYRLCLRYARDEQEAEDFLHEAFLVVFRDLVQYKGNGPLGGWLRRVTINVALQQLRKQKRLLYTDTNEDQIPDIADEEQDDLPPVANMQELINHIQALPTGYRTVFNLFVIENFSHQDIAAQLGISIGASKSQLSKAKAMLRQKLALRAAVS
ncbi:MAG: sigma-70 family RNA polymerase sigma factor [Saprospiraceae bacterium]